MTRNLKPVIEERLVQELYNTYPLKAHYAIAQEKLKKQCCFNCVTIASFIVKNYLEAYN